MIIARARTGNGETVLRQGSAGYELIVDGQFLMSSASAPSSEELVRAGLARVAKPGGIRVLIGGLGLGYSLRIALANSRVASVTVIEIEATLIDWHRRGLLPETAGLMNDPRLELVGEDLVRYLQNCRGQYDLIALDIDNGPEWLSHPGNRGLYTEAMLGRIKDCLSPAGAAAFWSADPAPELERSLRTVFGRVEARESLDSNGAGKAIPAYIYLI
jgi:spermidine synthase